MEGKCWAKRLRWLDAGRKRVQHLEGGGSKWDAIYVKMLYMYIEEEKTDKNECRCPMRYERFIVTHVCHSLSTFMAALHIQLYISHHHIQFQKRVSNIHINSQLKHTHSTKTILSPTWKYTRLLAVLISVFIRLQFQLENTFKLNK